MEHDFSFIPLQIGGFQMKRPLLFSSILCLLIGLLVGVLIPIDFRPEKPATADAGTMTFATLDTSGSSSSSGSAASSQPAPSAPPANDNFPLLNTACVINQALRQRDYATVAKYVHPERGVTFTPYSTVNFDSDLSFKAAQIQGLTKDQTVYSWGFEDGRGDPIKMTMEQYFARYVYDTDYTHASMIGVDQIVTTGNALENLTEEYPGCRFVDFCLPSADPANDGLDWRSLKLVFQMEDTGWFLVGIVHGEWTV